MTNTCEPAARIARKPKPLEAANLARKNAHALRALRSGVTDRLSVRKRTRNKVVRHSRHAGDEERRLSAKHNVFTALECEVRLKHLFNYADEQRQKGQANGLLTPAEKDILVSLYHGRDFTTGFLDMAWSSLKAAAGRCYETISRAMSKFERIGCIIRIRRTEPIENPEPGGQTQTQVNNAYILVLPAEVERRVAAELALLRPAEPTCPPPPTEEEEAGLVALQIAPPLADPELETRRRHWLSTKIWQLNVRRNAGKFAAQRDSTF